MDKTPKQVTKYLKRQEAARKGREKYINKLKESILNDVTKSCGGELVMQTMILPTPPPALLSPLPLLSLDLWR